MNPRSSPMRISQTHLTNQIDDLARNRRSAQRMAAFPSPIQSEPFPVPGDDSFGLDYRQCGFPIAPKTREPNPHESVGEVQTQPMVAIGTLENQELMPQG